MRGLKYKGEKVKKVLLKIGGMTCSACSTGLEKFLNKQERNKKRNSKFSNEQY